MRRKDFLLDPESCGPYFSFPKTKGRVSRAAGSTTMRWWIDIENTKKSSSSAQAPRASASRRGTYLWRPGSAAFFAIRSSHVLASSSSRLTFSRGVSVSSAGCLLVQDNVERRKDRRCAAPPVWCHVECHAVVHVAWFHASVLQGHLRAVHDQHGGQRWCRRRVAVLGVCQAVAFAA